MVRTDRSLRSALMVPVVALLALLEVGALASAPQVSPAPAGCPPGTVEMGASEALRQFVGSSSPGRLAAARLARSDPGAVV